MNDLNCVCVCVCVCVRLVNQRLLEGQSQVEELQNSLQEHGSKADDVSPAFITLQPRC